MTYAKQIAHAAMLATMRQLGVLDEEVTDVAETIDLAAIIAGVPKPDPELTDARIQQLWNENADHTPNWNRHNAFARAIELELRDVWCIVIGEKSGVKP